MPHSHGNNNNNNNKQKQTTAPEILLLGSLLAFMQRRCTKTEVEKHSVRVVESGRAVIQLELWGRAGAATTTWQSWMHEPIQRLLQNKLEKSPGLAKKDGD